MAPASNKDSNKLRVTSNELSNNKPCSLRKKVTRYSLLVIKLFISGTFFYMLASKVGGRAIIDNIRLLNPLAFIAAVALYLFSAYLSTLRWKLLIPQQIDTGRLFSMYMIGSFFNTYMPGIIGGDAVKAYYMSRELKGRTSGEDPPVKGSRLNADHYALAIASVFMDRYIGFCALLILGAVAFPFGIQYLEGASVKWPVMWVLPAFLVTFAAASLAIFKFRFGERLNFLFKMYSYFQIYSSKRGALIRAFSYSLVIQVLGIIAIYILSNGLSLDISFLSLLIFVPIIILVSFLPLSISGIGLREGAFVLLLGSVGVSPKMSMTLSITWFLSVFIAGIWGLFEYLRFKTVLGGKEE
ncbi:MAG: flippase-like domain-containing protein [Nitrospirae bacterium]|nr:flippase-like domain-containing protein [Nitrospirota bacterium]